MRLARGLTIKPDRTLQHQVRAVGSRTHDSGTPQPLIQPLPVFVFYVGYRTPPLRSAARAANGPPGTFIGDTVAPVTTGRRRRSGISMAGAGGPCWSSTRPAAGKIRNPSRRSTAGSIVRADPKAGCQARRKRGRPPACAITQFAGDFLGDIQPQQDRSSFYPARHGSKSWRPVGLVRRQGNQRRGRQGGHRDASVQGPKPRPHRHRTGFHQRRNEQREPAGAHAQRPQPRPQISR